MITRRARVFVVAALCLLACARLAVAGALPPHFQETTAFSGLVNPTVVKFAPDGRVFVAEKSGLIKVFASISATTPTIFADLRWEVQDYWDRGLLGMELDPAFPTRPYVYVLYALDKNPVQPSSPVPTWNDDCPTPPGANDSGCTVIGRISRLDASAPWPVGATEQVLLEGFPHQFPSHSVGALAFGADGALYVTGGEGANFIDIDYGQFGGASGAGPGQYVPFNPLGDPPGGIGVALSPPYAQGGALRSQSIRRPSGQPASLSGVMLRLDPNTGAALPDNPLAGSADQNARRIVAYGLRNPFRMAVRPGTSEVWVGDVGWNGTEEINRLNVAGGTAPNFGWPCYEGASPQPAYAAAGLASCLSLYVEGSATPPYYAYDHSAPVVPGDVCQVGSSSVTGLAFYTSGNYPAAYQGALFFTDYSRKCIWAMFPNAGGVPDPAQIMTFDSGLPGGPVNLERGPGGDIFYVDLEGGRIQRISYFASNLPPVAAVSATPTSGTSPLFVQLDASGSIDPEGAPLSYFWDLDGDGTFTDSTAVNPTFTYATSGKHTATVIVTDLVGFSVARVNIYVDNLPPVAAITTPASSVTWKVGDQIFFAGTASDTEEGALPPSAFHWTLQMHHCPSNCHIHTIQSWNGVAGGSFSAPDHEYPSWIELSLTVTDSLGLSDTTSVELQPRTVALTVNSVPSGMTIAVGSGAVPTPFTRTVIVGSNTTVSAQTPQESGGQMYGFVSWSDGGQATHQISAPATPLSLTATYQLAASLSISETVTPLILKGGRAIVNATVSNAGPISATGVVLTETLPPATSLISSTPPGICTQIGNSAVCNLPNLAPSANTAVTFILKVSQIGNVQLTGTVASQQGEMNPLDNTTSVNVVVRPVGDIDGDGHEDLVWRSGTTGQVIAWFMNGLTFSASGTISPSRGPDLNWRLVGLGDFDADGKPDVVWRNQATGADEIWLMNGTTQKSAVPILTVPDVGWQIVGVGDFNGDGWPDLLWRHQTGITMMVYMTGTTISGSAPFVTAPDPWQIAGVADFNSDGGLDQVWRRSTDGLSFALLMSGLNITNALPMFNPMDVNWRPVSFADLNGDGKPDLVLRNQVSGVSVVIYLDGVNAIGYGLLPTVPDLAWALIGPR
jgi:glucose/arabinose dehydrogenase